MSVACCPLESSDGEGPSCFARAFPVAAKLHKCGECRETIAKGSKYERASGLWDGSWSTMRTCMSCVEIRDHFACNGFVYGQLWRDLGASFFPDMKAGGPCMEGLSPAAKARLFARRMTWLEARR